MVAVSFIIQENVVDHTKEEAIKAKVDELFPYAGSITNYRPRGFSIEFRYHDTSFEDLEKISKAFGTKNINMGTEERSEGYCETCHYSYTVNIVQVDGHFRGVAVNIIFNNT